MTSGNDVMDTTTKFLSGLRQILDDEQVPEVEKEILRKYFRRAME